MNVKSDPEVPALLRSGGEPSVRFSAQLRDLLKQLGDAPIQIRELLEATQQHSIHLILLLIALPFVGPVPLPGFSTPFGLVVTMLGTAMALGRKSWLPEAFLRRELSPQFLGKLLRGTSRIMEFIERFLRPRLGFVESNMLFSRVAGILIAVSGLLLMLPLPIPFSNSIPAWTVIFLAAGSLCRDGLFFFIGCASFLVSVVFFALLALGGIVAVEHLLR